MRRLIVFTVGCLAFLIPLSIYAQTDTVSVPDVFAAPGSIGVPVYVELNNTQGVGGVQFTLAFDGSLLEATDVERTSRTSHMDLGFNIWSDSVKVLLYSAGGDSVLPGTDFIIQVFFDVDGSASSGDSTLLHFTQALLSDPDAHPIGVLIQDGWFHFTGGEPDIYVDPVDMDHDFGVVAVGDSADWSFYVHNIGGGDLILYSFVTEHTVFTVQEPSCPDTIAPADSSMVTVWFKPSAKGTSNDTLSISSNDPDTVKIHLQGSTPVVSCTLSVSDGYGAPGDISVPVDIDLNNTIGVGGVQFTLGFDGSFLEATGVERTPRTSHMDLGFNIWSDSVKVLLYSVGGDSVLPGMGSIIQVLFDVDGSVSPGDSTLLHFTQALLSDPGAQPIDVVTEDGWFPFLQPPEANANGPYRGVVGEPVEFDGSASADSDGVIVSYQWDFGDDSTGTSVNPSHAYDNYGTFQVILTVTDDDGLSDSDTTTAEIGVPPVADADGPYTGVAGEPVEFDGSASADSDGVIVSYQWDFGDDSTGTSVNLTHTYANYGIFQVILTVTDDDTLTDIDTTTAEIGVPPVADADGPYQGVVGEPVDFDGSASADSDGVIVSYCWGFGDDSTATGVTPTHVYNSCDTFQVILTVMDNDSLTDQDTTTAVILCPPVAVAISPDTGVVGTPIEFHGSDSYDLDGTIISYKWDFGDDSTGVGDSVSHTYMHTDIYLVVLTVKDNDSLTSSDSVFVDIGPTGIDVWQLSNVPDNFALSQNYPNPFNPETAIRFDIPRACQVSLRIYNVTGQLLRELIDGHHDAGSYEVRWDGRDCVGRVVASGLYFCRFKAGEFGKTVKMIHVK